jgi:hypothetical protein
MWLSYNRAVLSDLLFDPGYTIRFIVAISLACFLRSMFSPVPLPLSITPGAHAAFRKLAIGSLELD